MTSKSILVVEDEQEVRELLNYTISRAGYDVETVADAESALSALDQKLPDLMLIDWMLPQMSGIELARRLLNDEVTKQIPMIMLTARSEEADKLKSFESGLDDYVTKPFSPRELNARIKALLRRSSNVDEKQLEVNGLSLDTVSHSVSAYGNNVHLSPTEYGLLKLFLRHPNRAFYRSQLLNMVWGRNVYIDERTVDVHVLRLRKALEPHNLAQLIQTVRGVGYRFNPALEGT